MILIFLSIASYRCLWLLLLVEVMRSVNLVDATSDPFNRQVVNDENELENGTNSKTQSPFEKCQSSTSISICFNPKNKSSPNYFLNESKAEYDCETASWKLTLNRKATDQIFFQANLKESNSSCQHQLNLKYQESQTEKVFTFNNSYSGELKIYQCNDNYDRCHNTLCDGSLDLGKSFNKRQLISPKITVNLPQESPSSSYNIEFHHDFEFDYYDIEVYHTANQSCKWKRYKMSEDDSLNKQMKKKRFAFDPNYLNCFNNSAINLTFYIYPHNCALCNYPPSSCQRKCDGTASSCKNYFLHTFPLPSDAEMVTIIQTNMVSHIILPIVFGVIAFTIVIVSVVILLRRNEEKQVAQPESSGGTATPLHLLANEVLLIYDKQDSQVRDNAASLHRTLSAAGISTVYDYGNQHQEEEVDIIGVNQWFVDRIHKPFVCLIVILSTGLLGDFNNDLLDRTDRHYQLMRFLKDQILSIAGAESDNLYNRLFVVKFSNLDLPSILEDQHLVPFVRYQLPGHIDHLIQDLNQLRN